MSKLAEELEQAYQSQKKNRHRKRPAPQVRGMREGKWKGWSLMWLLAALLIGFIIWAEQAEIDSMVRASGKVIPSSSNQVVQSLEGGIVESIAVKEGGYVNSGDMLLRIQNKQFTSELEVNVASRDAIEARMVRLNGEAKGLEYLNFPDWLSKYQPELVKMERELFQSRMKDQKTKVDYSWRRLQKEKEKLWLLSPKFDRGTLPKVDKIDIEAKIVDLEEKMETIKTSFVRQALEQYDEEREKLSTIQAAMKGDEDKVKRTEIFSPINGTINTIHIKTAGRVISPGEPIMEIVPVGDSLIIEAKVRPADIGFLHKDQVAIVNFTAYDFAIYGGLEGKIETIGVDTIYDEETKETYYPVKIRTLKNNLGKDKKTGETLELVPGMISEVSVITGKRTVLDYILKPINRARQHALREP